MSRVVLICMSLSALLISTQVRADGFFRLSTVYLTESDNQGGTTTTETRWPMDIYLGYLDQGGWTIFGQYGTENDKSESGGTASTSNRTTMALGIGYMARKDFGPFITGSYFLDNKLITNGTTYSGDGYQVALGIKMNVSRFFFTVELDYRNTTYKKSGTSELNPKWVHTNLEPMLGAMFEF